MIKNTMKAIDSLKRINPRYDMCIDNINEIMANSDHIGNAIIYAFRFGYLQGRKAGMKEIEKKLEYNMHQKS